jgi:hypothetical protein
MNQAARNVRRPHSHHRYAPLITYAARPHPFAVQVQVPVQLPDLSGLDVVHVPGRTRAEGERFLRMIGSGATGTGAQDLWLGQALPWMRTNYYKALEEVEREIAERRAQAGSKLRDPVEMEKFVQWAIARRNAVARWWRLPAGPGGVLGGEIRDIKQYGPGGRTLPNLLKRVETKYGETGMTALERIASSATKPNDLETVAIMRGAKYLKYGGAVLFVGGLVWTGYDIYKAPEGQRVEVAKKEGIGMVGGLVGSNLAVGVCFLLGASGVGLVVVGLVAGVAGAMAAEKLYYSHSHDQVVQDLHVSGQTGLMQIRGPAPY